MSLLNFDLKLIVDPLLHWFQGHGRMLPWREDPTPYRVWVSEIMLQQTRVEAVKPYFERFMKALPTISELAECEEDDLLKLWEGLGYYNRVRNMQKAARIIVEEYGGEVPANYMELLKLPGIGNYTAGAIGSIAYGLAVPAVDGNVLRVISRVTADDSDIAKESTRRRIEEVLKEIMPKAEASDFNQALMELGATVCLPNGKPLCEFCPWQEFCETNQQGLWSSIPVKSKAKARRLEKRTVFVILDSDQVILQKRPARGLLSGLYEFPNVEGSLSEEEALSWVKEQKINPLRIQKLKDAKHIFSHVEWHMTGYVIYVEGSGFPSEIPSGGSEKTKTLFFVEIEETREKYPIPSAFGAYREYLLRL